VAIDLLAGDERLGLSLQMLGSDFEGGKGVGEGDMLGLEDVLGLEDMEGGWWRRWAGGRERVGGSGLGDSWVGGMVCGGL